MGAASRYVGPDRRACPYLVLVSTLTPTKASRQLPRPFVVELKRRRTVIIGARQMHGAHSHDHLCLYVNDTLLFQLYQTRERLA